MTGVQTCALPICFLLPIWGVLRWDWDVFVLLVVYWLETAIIGIWTIARIGITPPGSMGPLLINGRPTNSRFAMTAFFIVHAGMFMGGHLLFLWVIFSDDWSKVVHGPIDFFNVLIVRTGLWIPLLALFVVRGFGFFFRALKPEYIQRVERALWLPVTQPPAPENMDKLIALFYARVVIMHVTILFGAVPAKLIGSIAPLIILVLLKTVVDVVVHLAVDFGHAQKLQVSVATSP